MALINSLSGITEISDNLYEVTSLVSIGSGIDDVADSTFIMKDGGLLKWATGCDTTFTNCIFHETETALALGVDNFQTYQPGYPPRFSGTCAPVFRGCQWICNTSARSDFDATADAAMTFEYDDEQNPCRIIVRNDAYAQYNHLTSDDMVINGLVVDQNGAGAAAEFASFPIDPNQWSNLKVINYDGTSETRHVSFLLNGTTADTEYTIKSLTARNVALVGGQATVRGVDPIGRVLKTNDVSFSDDGNWEVYRTYAGSFIDAVTGNLVQGRAVYTKANSIVSNEHGTAYSTELLQYSQAIDTVDIVTEPDYTEVLQVYGYQPQTRTITLQDETNPLANTKDVFVFADPIISETNKKVVRDYTEIDTADKLYDRSRFFALRSNDPSILGYDIMTAQGSTLDLGNHNLIVDPTFDFAFGYTSSNTIAVPGTPALTEFTSWGRLYKEESSETNLFTDSDFDAVFSATASYRLNNFQFNEDGSKVFAFGTASSSDSANVIIEYALSTNYDLSTATQISSLSSGYINGQQGYARIVSNGTKIIWSKRWGTWYSWDLATAWDLSTAGSRVDIAMDARRTGFDFNHDGTKLFTCRDGGDTAGTYIYQYTLSTPYDVSSRGASTEVNLGHTSANLHDLFDAQRTMLWFKGGNFFAYNDPVAGFLYMHSVATAYDASTSTLVDTLEVAHSHYTADPFTGLEIVGNENKLFLAGCDDVGGYPIASYELHEQRDFTGAAETIYVKTTTLSGSNTFGKLLTTTGYITFQNGSSTNMIVQDANGLQLSVTVNNVIPGSRVQLYNVTKDTELSNEIALSAPYTYGYLAGVVDAEIEAGDEIRIRIAYASGTTAYDWYESTVFASNDGVLASATQIQLTPYITLGIDGSTVTEFTLDNPNIDVDLNDPDGLSQKKRLVAWLYYIVANDADGMRNFFKVVDLLDAGNAVLRVDVADVKVDNIGTKQVIFTDTDFYLYRSDGASWVQYPSTGNYGITSDSGKIYVAVVNGSGSTDCPTASEIAIAVNNTLDIPTSVEVRQEIDNNSTQLASIRTTAEAIPTDNSVDLTGVTDGLDVINRGVKKASLFVPHDEDI